MHQAATGHQPAFAALYQRYAGRLLAFILPRCGQDLKLAEDLRQQLFLQLLESKYFAAAQGGDVRDDLSSLLFTMAANLLKNTYRSKERKVRRESTYQFLQTVRIGSEERKIDEAVLESALLKITPAQRTCVDLKFRRGLSIAEISTALDLAPGTVKSRLHYGLKKLGELLADKKEEWTI